MEISKQDVLSTLLLLVILFLAATNTAQAYHFPWDQGHDTTDYPDPDDPGPPNDPLNDCNKGQGSPVYIAKGHFIWTDADISLAGRPTISVHRTYNSHDPRQGIFGNGWSSNCEPRLNKVVDGEGAVSFFHVVSSGKRYEYKQADDGSVTAPPGQQNTLTTTGSTTRLTTKTGSFQEFNAAGRLLTSQTEDGLAKNYEYDDNGNITKISSDDRFLAFNFDSTGRVASIQDHTSRTWTYTYDVNGNLINVADPSSGVREYEYQSYDDLVDGFTYQQLTKITDESGVVDSEIVYDKHRVSSYTNGSNQYSYSYDPSNKQVTKSDSTSRVRAYKYNDNELITASTDPLNNTSTKTYDTEGNLTRYTDKIGNTWDSTYTTGNRLLSTTSPLGRTSKFEFKDESPKPVKIISAAGNTTTITYDDKLHPIAVTDPANNQATLSYDSNGNISSISDAQGNTATISYNASNMPVSYTDAKGNVTTNTYDTLQRLVSVTDPEGRTTTHEYDDLDRLIKTTNSLGHVSTYNYDAAGRLLSFTDPTGNVTSSEYDDFGRLAKETRPDGRSSQYTYDEANLLTTIALYDGKTIAISYDAEERITSSSIDGDTINYSYNARGDLTQTSNPTATINLSYNADGEQTQEDQAGIVLDKSYNADSALTQLKVLGQTLDYQRDPRNLVTKLANGSNAFDLAYDSNSLLTSVSMPNGTSEAKTYDNNYNLTNIISGSNTLDYSHDSSDLITGKTSNGSVTNYSYDALKRLTQAGSDSYNYDTAGNNLNNDAKYDPKTNQLTEDNTYTYTYDDSGNLTQKQKKDGSETKTYTFNNRNQLTRVETLDNTDQVIKALEFSYDPFGRRFSKTTDGEFKRYVYSGVDMVAIVDGGGSTLSSFNTLGVDNPLSITTDGNTYYYHRDHQGSIVSLSDSGGSDVETYAYDAYGVTSKTSSAETGNPFGYTGREFDDDDLYYYRARYYDPQTQHFVTSDPIGLAGGINTYGYVKANPINRIDPFGQRTAIINNGPTDGNPIGHSAIAITGLGVYSYGNSTKPGSSLTDYLLRESPRRDTNVMIINTTSEQEEKIHNYLLELVGKPLQGFPYYPDNCTARVSGALNSSGIPYPSLFGNTTSIPTNLPIQVLSGQKKHGGEILLVPKDTTKLSDIFNEFNPSD